MTHIPEFLPMPTNDDPLARRPLFAVFEGMGGVLAFWRYPERVNAMTCAPPSTHPHRWKICDIGKRKLAANSTDRFERDRCCKM
jgi:hypothetical protein